ncbi:AAA-domain-containing protein [Trichodelitschia bisporula]|uniref:Peroxisomal ATPase PEX1 n=1 Tax=Trichodelitschia bisporula TaxID=703511 RepID=A0A6G1IBT7_9PEZI|nr:AAA-domain-containing protein [Trichodelitschia bisporula]
MPPKRPAVQAEVALLHSLKSCLVNLPASLVVALSNANTVAQNVVVELSYRDKTPKSVFLGWTGMQSKRRLVPVVSRDGIAGVRGNREQEVPLVEMDTAFARLLGITDGQKVSVTLHVDPPQAHTINIEPLTPVDWEMIELHAQFLELNFLSQVRALPNPSFTTDGAIPHPITLHLSPTSTANIVVTSIAPIPTTPSPFIKISADAEVIVAPKERKPAADRERGVSTGRRSSAGRSGASTVRRKSSRETTRGVVFLRGVERGVVQEWFDDTADADTGLKVWVDRDVLLSKALRNVTWVAVSVVRPVGLLEAVDPQKEAAETEKPTLKLVAQLLPWDEAPDSHHVALSSPLCKALASDGMVGGPVKLEAAPALIAKGDANAVRKLKVLPFGAVSQGLKLGAQAERDAAARVVKDVLGDLLEGPLIDGMLLPTSDEFAGGILRFDPPVPATNGKRPMTWFLGSERKLPLEVAPETPKPVSSLKPWSPGEALPATPPVMVGIDPLIEQLTSNLAHSSSVLLTGGLGAGKTNLAQLVAHRLRHELLFHTAYFSCRNLVTEEARVSTIKEALTRLFASAAWGARRGGRALIVLDDLDRLCPVETELQVGGENGRSRHVSETLCAIVRQFCGPDSGVVLLATAQSKEALNNVVVGGHVVREITSLSAPNKDGRRRVLEMLARGEAGPADGPSFSVAPHIDFLDLAGQTDGYMPGDLVLLTARARSECLIRTLAEAAPARPGSAGAPSTFELGASDFAAALKGFTPASLRNVTLQSSSVEWSSIGGLHTTRQMLLETLQYPTTYAPIFAKCPLRLRSGLLLYGFPGCGKTLLASAIASTANLNFISVKGPEILNKYIGASEKSVRDLFERAQAARPCVLFFDEFDAIAPKRGHDSTGVTDRVVNQLLTQMDGAEGLSGVYVLAATSRPDLIDPALLRPGRLDKSLLCGMPDAHERADILRAVAAQVRVGPEVGDRWPEVAAVTEGFSGADLQALVYNAQLEAVHEALGEADVSVGRRVNGAGEGGKGGPDFTYFRFGDPEVQFDEEVGSKALAERARVAAQLRELAVVRRKMRAGRRDEVEGAREVYHSGEEEAGPKTESGHRSPVIEWRHMQSSLKATRASISAEERRRLDGIYRSFVVGRSGDLPSGQGGTDVGGRVSLM